MEKPGRGYWALDFQDDFSVEGRPTELPGGGMPGLSGEEDGNAGKLPALECPRHRGDYGVTKIPPPTVRLMQHSGPQEDL